MKKMCVRVIAAGAISLGLFGCGRKLAAPVEQTLTLRPGVHQTNNVVRFYKDLPPDGALVQVGTRTLTRSDFEERVAEWVDLQKVGASKPLDKEAEERLEQSGRRFVFMNYMARAAMLEEAVLRGIKPSEGDLNDAETFITQMARRMRLKRADFAKRTTGGEAAVAQRIREEATLKALIRSEFGTSLDATAEDAEKLKTALIRLRDEAVATNQVFSARLAQVRERLISGEATVSDDKAAVQAQLPPDLTFDGVMTCQAFNIDYPQSREALSQLKQGEWSSVVALDETFEIYQLRTVESNDDKDLVVYTFVQFSAPRDSGWEVPDVGQLKSDISRRRRQEKQTPWGLALITKAGVLYPNGIQLFGQAQKPAAQTAPNVLMKKPTAGVKHVHGQGKEKVAE
jgi:hypothetical protein